MQQNTQFQQQQQRQQQQQQQQTIYHQLCLILTPECIVPEEVKEKENGKGKRNEEEEEEEGNGKRGYGVMIKKDTMERIERFSMLVARPVGVVVFMMNPGKDEVGGGGGRGAGGGGGMRDYMIFMNW